MFGRHRHRQGSDYVEPDLPITPMLDMSFQLLAFFIMTFQPTKPEAQIMVALPAQQGGENSVPDVLSQEDKPVQISAQVMGNGGKMTRIRVFRAPAAGESGKEIDPITFDVKEGDERSAVKGFMENLQSRLRTIQADKKTAKLQLEIEESVLQAYVVQVFDAGVRSFQMVFGANANADISPVPLDAGKR